MNHQPENRQAEFAAIIKKLKKRRTLTLTLTLIAYGLLFLLATPMELEILGASYQYPGWPGGISVPLALIILLVALISYGNTILTIDKAFDEECDPEKYLALYTALGSKRADDPHRPAVLFTAYFYMGRYAEAMPYAQQLTQNKKPIYRAEGHFFCAQLGYFTGNAALLREAALRYRADLATVEKMSAKNRALFDGRTVQLAVMEGLCDGNHQAVAEAIPHMKPWAPAPVLDIMINLLKGIAALPRPDGGDRDEAVHRFMTVKEKGGRTCFAAMAEWYLAQLKGGASS